MSAFLGIPYARSPVGQLRFAEPHAYPPWSGVRDALSLGPVPPQSRLAGPPLPRWTGSGEAELWLTVNVWTRDLEVEDLPVLVWLFGRAYMSGASSNPTYDGARLAQEARAVVVTLNYRVAVEGFLSIEGAWANRGLLDQAAALRWVRDHIASFGGDPAKVTLFGQSAGAGCVAALLAMPEAEGLMAKAIVQSLPRTFLSSELSRDIAAELVNAVDARPARAELAAVPPQRLVAAGDQLTRRLRTLAHRFGPLALTPSPYAPVIDGDTLTATPWSAIERGAAQHVDLLVGHTRDEYRLSSHARAS